MRSAWIVVVALVAGCRTSPRIRVVDLVAAHDGTAVSIRQIDNETHLARLDAGGEVLWDVTLPRGIASMPSLSVSGDLVVVRARAGTNLGVRSFALSDGHEVWRSELVGVDVGRRPKHASTPSSLIEIVGDQVFVLESTTGRELRRVTSSIPDRDPFVVGEHAIFDGLGEGLVIGRDGHWVEPLRSRGCTMSGDYYGFELDEHLWLVTIPAAGHSPHRVATLPGVASRCFGYGNSLLIIQPNTSDLRSTQLTLMTRDGVSIASEAVPYRLDPAAYDASEATRFWPVIERDGLALVDLEHLAKPPVLTISGRGLTAHLLGSLWYVANEHTQEIMVIDGETGFTQTASTSGLPPSGLIDRTNLSRGAVWLHSEEWSTHHAVARLDPGTLVPTLTTSEVEIAVRARATAGRSGRSDRP